MTEQVLGIVKWFHGGFGFVTNFETKEDVFVHHTGITTTIDLHKKILSHKKFINSDFDVNWLVKETFY